MAAPFMSAWPTILDHFFLFISTWMPTAAENRVVTMREAGLTSFGGDMCTSLLCREDIPQLLPLSKNLLEVMCR